MRSASAAVAFGARDSVAGPKTTIATAKTMTSVPDIAAVGLTSERLRRAAAGAWVRTAHSFGRLWAGLLVYG
jgi:hypothetical protein